jgi:transposase-like protein
MISNSSNACVIDELMELFTQNGLDRFASLMSRLFNELMKAERERVLEAKPYERTQSRQGYANGFKDKKVQTRFGELQLQVPQTRNILFYPNCLEKGERSERALKIAIAEMYVQGVSTRRVSAITEELCGFELSSTQVSRATTIIDEELEKFRNRPIGRMAYLYLDADYQKVRHNGQVIDMAVLKAIGVTAEGKREILGVSCRLSEAEVHWRQFLEELMQRGLQGVEMIISDDHAGLQVARRAVLPSVPWQRCIFHMAQNAQHYAPTMSMRSEIAHTMREIYQARGRQEAESRVQEAVNKYAKQAPRFCAWLEENAPEGMTFYGRPQTHWKRVRTVNIVERLNCEVKRRTRVVRLFPNVAACERLVTAILVEIHDEWVGSYRYLPTEQSL